MSRTNKHRIEGLYHNGLISVEDVPISVKYGWVRHNARNEKHKTSGHEKKAKKDKDLRNIDRVGNFVNCFSFEDYLVSYKGLYEK